MNRVIVKISKASDKKYQLLAPEVAQFKPVVHNGMIVASGSLLGLAVTHRGQSHWLIPDGVAPASIRQLSRDKLLSLGYGEPIASLDPIELGAPEERAEGQGKGLHDLTFAAPTDGVFYHSPSPDQPPFIKPGDVITEGAVIGLIEVMKTFSRVLYGGEMLPPQATVKAFLARDGEEVLSGQPLLSLEPKG